MTHTDVPIVIVGGGLSGLVAATLAARAGAPVVLLEQSAAVGGRAATREKNGFCFNLGPHALYRRGALKQTLDALSVEVHGRIPGANGGFAIRGGRTHTLPAGVTSLLSTGVLNVSGKIEFARLQSRLLALDTRGLQGETLASWLDRTVHDVVVRQLIEMLVRVTTFTNDPQHQSAGAAIEQLQLAVRGSVLYLDGGWQTIVDGVRRVAIDAGVRIMPGAHAIAVERRNARMVDAVRLADGRTVPASAVIVAAGPGDVESLTGIRGAFAALVPVRVATLDLALRALPKPRRTVAFGVDVPLYFSVHSAVARLARDGGALIHVSKYLRPDETAGRGVEQELEALTDTMQPGWRDELAFKQFLPNLTVTHAALAANDGGAAGRPPVRLDAFDNVFVAGDWVGPRGQLSDAGAASAADAAVVAVASLHHAGRVLSDTPCATTSR